MWSAQVCFTSSLAYFILLARVFDVLATPLQSPAYGGTGTPGQGFPVQGGNTTSGFTSPSIPGGSPTCGGAFSPCQKPDFPGLPNTGPTYGKDHNDFGMPPKDKTCGSLFDFTCSTKPPGPINSMPAFNTTPGYSGSPNFHGEPPFSSSTAPNNMPGMNNNMPGINNAPAYGTTGSFANKASPASYPGGKMGAFGN